MQAVYIRIYEVNPDARVVISRFLCCWIWRDSPLESTTDDFRYADERRSALETDMFGFCACDELGEQNFIVFERFITLCI